MSTESYSIIRTTPYFMGNLVYGDRFITQFADYHLKSLLCETNLPAVLSGTNFAPQYIIFTDQESLSKLQQHPNVIRLMNLIPVHFNFLEWGDGTPEQAYEARYSALIALFQTLCRSALEQKGLFTSFAADLILAQGFLPRALERIGPDCDSVLCLPLRAAFEPMRKHLDDYSGAVPAEALAEFGYTNLHPLWTHSHWDNPQFSKLPFCLLWNSGKGLRAHTFSVSPLLLTPYPEMLESRHVMDAEIPFLCRRPFWAEDWLSAPVMEVGYLSSYYPPFSNKPASFQALVAWAKTRLLRRTHHFISRRFYYPSREKASFLAGEEHRIAKMIRMLQDSLQSIGLQ